MPGICSAGIFFLGYAALQVPSNLILLRVGAPTWLGVTVVSWGAVAALFAALQSPAEFYVLRFLLGITECGAFPGVVRRIVHANIRRIAKCRTYAFSIHLLGFVQSLQRSARYTPWPPCQRQPGALIG